VVTFPYLEAITMLKIGSVKLNGEPKWVRLDEPLAQECLDRMHPEQVRHKEAWISELASRFLAGKARKTTDALGFDVDKYFVNGYHRCHAVLTSHVPIDVLMVAGLPRGSYRGIDDGMRRTGADMMAGENNRKNLSGALLAYYRIKHGRLTARSGSTLSNDGYVEMKENHPEVRASLKTILRLYRECNKEIPSPTMTTALHAIFKKMHSAKMADAFWTEFAHQQGLFTGDPAYELRRALPRKPKRGQAQTLDVRMYAVCAMKACDAYAAGETVRKLTYKSGEDLPWGPAAVTA
jgi:hypothetical protein